MISARARMSVAWVVLVAITVTYLWIDESADTDNAATASTAATVSAIVLALVKFRIVLREFMDVRHAPQILRLLCDALVAVVGTALLVSYLVGRAVA